MGNPNEDLRNPNVDISVQTDGLGGVSGIKKTIVPTVNQVNNQQLSQQPLSQYDSFELQKALEQIATPVEGLSDVVSREGKLTSNDLFPNLDQSVTHQGFSGEGFSAPAVAAPGAVFPFAALAKFQQNKRMEDAYKMEAFQKANKLDFEVPTINNPRINAKFAESYLGWYTGKIEKFKSLFGEKYGMAMKADPEFNVERSLYNTIANSYNGYLTLANDILAGEKALSGSKDKDIYIDPVAKKAAYELYQGLDGILENKNANIKDLQTWIDGASANANKLIVSKGLNNVITDTAESLKKSNESAIGWFEANKSNMGTADIKAYIKNTLKTPFIKEKTDKSGNVIGFEVDENANKEYWKGVYEGETGNKVEEGKDGKFKITESGLPAERQYDPNEFIKRGMMSITRNLEPTVEKFDTHARDYADLNFRKKQHEDTQQVVFHNVSKNTGIVAPNGTNQYVNYVNTTQQVTDPETKRSSAETKIQYKGQVHGIGEDGKPVTINIPVTKQAIGFITDATPEQASAYGLNPNVKTIQVIRYPKMNADNTPVLDESGANVWGTVYEPLEGSAIDAANSNAVHVKGVNDASFEERGTTSVKTNKKVEISKRGNTPPKTTTTITGGNVR